MSHNYSISFSPSTLPPSCVLSECGDGHVASVGQFPYYMYIAFYTLLSFSSGYAKCNGDTWTKEHNT